MQLSFLSFLWNSVKRKQRKTRRYTFRPAGWELNLGPLTWQRSMLTTAPYHIILIFCQRLSTPFSWFILGGKFDSLWILSAIFLIHGCSKEFFQGVGKKFRFGKGPQNLYRATQNTKRPQNIPCRCLCFEWMDAKRLNFSQVIVYLMLSSKILLNVNNFLLLRVE